MILNPSTITRPANNGLKRKWLVAILCSVCAVALHALIPMFAAGLSQSEPSYAGDVFPWVSVPTQQSLTASQTGSSQARAGFLFIATCAGLFVFCGVMLRVAKGLESLAMQTFIFCSGAAFLISYLFAPVMLSTDVYAYAVYGRVLSLYGGNPYTEHPSISPDDPFMALYGGDYLASWYGPLWTLISGSITGLTGENVGLTVLVFRGLSVIAALAGSAFVWASLRKLSPKDATRGLVFLLWNPLLVIETGLSGHNDAFMVAFVLCGIWLHTKGWKAGAVIFLTLSALVKFLTGMLIPLYVLLVLREARSWRERAAFLARSALGAGAVAIAAFFFANAGDDVPAAHSATAPDFYANNFHEHFFNALRRAFGEDAASVSVPIYFGSAWIATRDTADLRTTENAASPVIRTLPPGETCLLIAPHRTKWFRVYDPVSKAKGYIYEVGYDKAQRPPAAAADPVALTLEKLPTEWPTVRKANRWLRAATWLGFAAFGLLAAWRTTNFTQFLVWSAASLLASYYFIITEIWPWYPIWAVSLGAMAPSRRPAQLAMLLSGCVLTLYLTIDYQGSKPEWIFDYRSIPAFVLPLAVFALICVVQARNSTPHARSD